MSTRDAPFHSNAVAIRFCSALGISSLVDSALHVATAISTEFRAAAAWTGGDPIGFMGIHIYLQNSGSSNAVRSWLTALFRLSARWIQALVPSSYSTKSFPCKSIKPGSSRRSNDRRQWSAQSFPSLIHHGYSNLVIQTVHSKEGPGQWLKSRHYRHSLGTEQRIRKWVDLLNP